MVLSICVPDFREIRTMCNLLKEKEENIINLFLSLFRQLIL